MLKNLRRKLEHLKQETFALVHALSHPRTPWAAKVIIGLVALYAASPIDLIPDFIPVIGILDDLILVPLGIAIAIRLIPSDVLLECRERARSEPITLRGNAVARMGMILVIGCWATVGAFVFLLVMTRFRH